MRQQNFIQLKTHQKQQGFSLLMVLAIMMVIAIMVVAGSQITNTEMRISANDADQKATFALAERALREAEIETVGQIRKDKPKKMVDYLKDGGVCSKTKACAIPAVKINGVNEQKVAAWERSDTFDGKDNAKSQEIKFANDKQKVSQNPRYIYELLSTEERIYLVRVTVRAWGKNPNTRVTLQSYLEIPV